MRTLLALSLGLTLGLVSCSNDKESPADAADKLAAALSKGSVGARLFSGESPQAEYDGITRGLGGSDPDVTASDVTEKDGTAKATLAWSWDLGEDTWDYASQVSLKEGESGWVAAWQPAVVEPSLEDGETLDVTNLLPRRGEILGAAGRPIVTDRPVVRFGIDKTKVPQVASADSARRLARLLDVTAAPFVKQVRAAGDKAFVEAIVMRPQDARQVGTAYTGIRGAVALKGHMPLAPTREFAAPLVGRVGPATEELIKESDGRLEVGDVVGLSGLQARYDEQLTGTAGVKVEAVADDGTTRTLFEHEAVDGEPLTTTLDLRLQTRAEQVLAVPDSDHPGPATALVAIRPSTGEILAAASGPGARGQNIATFGQYAPGSTFKVVSTLALLRSGLTPDSPVDCPATVSVNGKSFKNYDDYPADRLGRVTLRQAVANSCNTAFIGARSRVDAGSLSAAAEALGLGEDHDLGFPAYFGQVPPPASDTEAAADLIGQGKVLASPMTMAAVAASVQAGRTVVPHLLDDFAPAAKPHTPLTAAESDALRSLMRSVVTEGSGSILADLPGQVGAKTGTAEYGEPGPGGALPTHAWMIATQGDLAVAVFVETGESGSGTAGPLLRAFLS